jgi:putative tryptophan/tyrosine transport system substrate-binding protein
MVLLCGAVTVWPLVSRAQQQNRTRRLGVLMALAEKDAEGQKYIASFAQGLRELGWTGGDNIRIDYRWPGTDVGRIHAAAGSNS